MKARFARRLARGAALIVVVFAAPLASCGGGGGGGVVIDSAGGDSSVVCGNGQVEAGEQCDGDADCTTMCTFHECGDGLLGPDERCDDGNQENADACTSSCELGPEAIVDISLGEYFTCALSADSRVKCWGAASNGRLGQPKYSESIGDDEPPSDWSDVEVADDVEALVSGREYTCALRKSGNAVCWGSNGSGQLGYETRGNFGENESPAAAGDIPLSDIVALAAGSAHACAIVGAGVVTCWGSNNGGQLGYGDVMSAVEGDLAGMRGPVALPGKAVQITAGDTHTCARLDSGDVHCWGSNSSGQLGTGTPDNVGDDELPDSVGPIDLGGKAIAIDAGGDTTCAVLDDQSVRCWGANNSGVLGNGDTMDVGDRKTPAEEGVVMFTGEAVDVRVGIGHACALGVDANVYCWGSNDRVGYPDADQPALPGAAVRLGLGASRVEIGRDHACAITSAAGVRCWGTNTGGRLGNPEIGSTSSVSDPAMYGDVDVF